MKQHPDSADAPPAMWSEAGFEALLEAMAQGSQTAVWELIDRYSTNILRVVRRRLPAEIQSKVDPADIVQSVWKSLLRKQDRLQPFATPEQFVAYLAGMARLKVLETHRHFTACEAFDVHREENTELIAAAPGRDRTPSPLLDRRGSTPSSIVQTREKWEHALATAGDRGQQVVQLRLQGLTQDEIAEQLRLSKSTVRRILHSMLKSLET